MSYAPEAYIHELDRKAFDALNHFPKLIKLKEMYMANVDEKKAKIELLSNAVRLSENQMPEIYNLLPPICEKLGIEVPELYYVRSKEMNAATAGSTHPYIYVTSKLVEEVEPELIASVLAHECGHIASKHNLYHSIASQLIIGLDNSPLGLVPGINRVLTPSLIKAFLFWERCSELSADRAAVLCDGNADHIIDMLLKIHGYDADKVDRKEFLKQAMDLHDFVNEENANKIIEEMLIQGDSHPRLATRVYESYSWSQSDLCKGILDGTYMPKLRENDESEEVTADKVEETEVITAEMAVETPKVNDATQFDLQAELDRVNNELDRYTAHLDGFDYAVAVGVGIIGGIFDALFVGETVVTNGDIALSNEKVNYFIQEYAESRGLGKSRLKDAIAELEKAFPVAQDNVWKGAINRVTPSNHHLADLAHHPTPVGLLSAIIVRFLRVGTFVNRDGEWHFVFLDTTKEEIMQVAIPAVITGVLNWLVSAGEKDYEVETGNTVPKSVHTIAHMAASTPLLIEMAKCADNWFGHLVSDMGGSKSTAGGGMGIPGVFLSFLHELSSLPILKDSNLPEVVNDLYQNKKLDMRHELAVINAAKKQSFPVMYVELLVRLLYVEKAILEQMYADGEETKAITEIDWKKVIPFNNRTVDRMLTVAFMTFNIADTADAAVHAAIESGGNAVLFSGRFVARYNYVGAGRAAYAIIKEISYEKKEAELIHQKLILTEIKTEAMVRQLEEYKTWLEERYTTFIAEDIAEFLNGFDLIEEGIKSGNSKLVIRGNVTIQTVLGRKPQFNSQEEFDALMDAEEAFIL